ncbi:unnamed protein product [Notodromas monacha]|uniref:Signal recognition particle subunit SRP72 n=2 Tax=Notodromas monacha TaxID=399045 RepID=A0A7R9GC99_9CRUS|nr:unnamed protein product [Notodromas monacha]CAG0915611.1 unnamed protein product [Notodromas monacha]
MPTHKQDLSVAYAELAKFTQSRENERVIKTCNKILNENPGEFEVWKCKVVAYLQLSKFQDVVSTVERSKFAKELAFECAYAHYRLNNLSEALETLSGQDESQLKIMELKGQILYRLERFKDCQQVYKRLIRESADDYEDERNANLAAVHAQLIIEGEEQDVGADTSETYEQKYNYGCALIAKRRLAEAEQVFRGKSSLEEDELTEEEIETELAVIRVQLAYCLQLQKREKEALAMYNAVLKTRPDDPALLAVACNNIVAINREQNIFDSKKKMRSVPGPDAQKDLETVAQKFTRRQRSSMAFNHCVLAYHVHQMEQCRKLGERTVELYPELSGVLLRLRAASFWKEKASSNAVKVLSESSRTPEDRLENNLAAAQLLLAETKKAEAVQIFESLPKEVRLRLGVASVLVNLYVSLGKFEPASQLLNDAIGRLQKSKQPVPPYMLRHQAALYFKLNKPGEAAKTLETLMKLEPENKRFVVQLMHAYTSMGPSGASKAKELSKTLPDPRDLVKQVDVEALERANWAVAGTKLLKKQTPGGVAAPGTPSSPVEGDMSKHRPKADGAASNEATPIPSGPRTHRNAKKKPKKTRR